MTPVMAQTTHDIKAGCSYSYFSIRRLPDFHGPVCAGGDAKASATGNVKTGNLQEGKKHQISALHDTVYGYFCSRA